MNELFLLTRLVEEHKIELQSIATHINAFKLHFEELFKKADMPSEFYKIKEQLNGEAEKFDKFKNAIEGRLVTITELLKNFRQDFLDHLKIHPEIEERITKLENTFAPIKEELARKHENLQKEVLKQIAAFTQKFTSQLEKLQEDFIAHPKSILESNNELAKKFDQVSLDCSNAIKRCRNTDALQKILENKIKEFEKGR